LILANILQVVSKGCHYPLVVNKRNGTAMTSKAYKTPTTNASPDSTPGATGDSDDLLKEMYTVSEYCDNIANFALVKLEPILYHERSVVATTKSVSIKDYPPLFAEMAGILENIRLTLIRIDTALSRVALPARDEPRD